MYQNHPNRNFCYVFWLYFEKYSRFTLAFPKTSVTLQKLQATMVKRILIIILALLLCADCTNRGATLAFEQIDEEIEDNREAGLKHVISLMKSIDRYDQHGRMQLELLRYKAEDKCYVPHLSDSLISEVRDYFEEHGNSYEKVLAYYYTGCTYRDMGDYPLAATWIDKAEAAMESQSMSRKDSAVLSNICGQSSQICYMAGMYEEALRKIKLSFNIKEALGTADFWDYADMGRMAFHNDSIALASRFYRLSAADLMRRGLDTRYMDFAGELLGFFVNTGDSSMSKKLAHAITESDDDIKHANVLSALADYYAKTEHDENLAMHYYLLALDAETDHRRKAELCKSISLVLHEKGNDKDAVRYILHHFAMADSAAIDARRAETQAALVRRHIEEIKEARQYKKDAEYKNSFQLYTYISCALALLCVILALLLVLRRRHRSYQHNIESLSGENVKIKEEKAILEQTLQTEARLRAACSHDIADVISCLRKLAESPHEKMGEEAWGMVLDAVDRQYPDFRKAIMRLHGEFDIKELMLIYMMKLEFSKADISRITKTSKSTISRRCQQIEAKLGMPLEDFFAI